MDSKKEKSKTEQERLVAENKEKIKELMKDSAILVVGPSKKPRTKLRVYAYGGKIGIIGTMTNHCSCGLLNKDYIQYLKNEEDQERLKDLINGRKGSQKERETLFSQEYLKLALKATKNRSEGEKTYQERDQENQIVKKCIRNAVQDGWVTVDMEFTNEKDKYNDKNCKVDIVVFDKKKGFGLIELKYNNQSCGNIDTHLEDFSKLAKSKNKIAEELITRSKYLLDYGIILEEWRAPLEDYEKSKEYNMWMGFLFLGGKREKSVDLIRELGRENRGAIEQCKFWYAKEIKDINLSYDHMQSYSEFIRE